MKTSTYLATWPRQIVLLQQTYLYRYNTPMSSDPCIHTIGSLTLPTHTLLLGVSEPWQPWLVYVPMELDIRLWISYHSTKCDHANCRIILMLYLYRSGYGVHMHMVTTYTECLLCVLAQQYSCQLQQSLNDSAPGFVVLLYLPWCVNHGGGGVTLDSCLDSSLR